MSLLDFSVAKMPSNNALHEAALANNLAEVQLQAGNFDVNAKGGYREDTALGKAAEKGYLEVVKLLLTLNADVNISDVSPSEMYFLILRIYITPTFVHLSCVMITRSRCTTFYKINMMFNGTSSCRHFTP